MPKKKKQKKQAAHAVLSQDEQRLLDRLLEDLETIDAAELAKRIPGPSFAQALLENLPLEGTKTPEILSEMRKAFPQKNVQKAVRKTAFRLKQRGITVPDDEPDQAPALAVAKEEPSAYIGPIDGSGGRPLLIVLPRGASGVDLAMGAVNDEQGIIEFIYGRYSKKRMKEVKDLFFSKVPHMVETTLSHVAAVLEQAYREEEGKPRPATGEYLRLRPWLLENSEPLDRPVVSDFIPMDSVTADMLTPTQLERLLRHDLMISWTLDAEKSRPLSEEITRAQESPIFISEGQRREHVNKIREESIVKLFGEKERMTFRTRLQEMAFVFFKIGDETLARLCLAAALSLDEKTSLLKVNPFLNALIDRSLGQKRRAAPSSPLILP